MTGDLPGFVGSDVSGVVVAIGPKTQTKLRVADEVYADAICSKGSFGGYLVVDANVASRKSKNLSMAEAASIRSMIASSWIVAFCETKSQGESVLA